MRDFFKIPHVTRQERTAGKNSCGRDKAVYQLQAARCPEGAGNAGNLRIRQDERNGLQNGLNNLFLLFAQVWIAERFCQLSGQRCCY